MPIFALLRKSLRSFRNLRRVVREQSLLKLVVIAMCACCLFLGLGVVFYEGFDFLGRMGGAGLMIVHRLFALFFFGLALMLVFSSLVTAYSTIYRSDEVHSLLVRPVPHGQLMLYKYLETAVLSSWAFFFMILPFVGAYALHEELGAAFILWTLLFAVPFVLLCSAVGTLACAILVRCLPGGRALKLLLVGALLIALALGVREFSQVPAYRDDAQLVLARLIPGIKLSSHALWPSWWVAEGIMSLGREAWGRGFLLWCVLMANVLLAGGLVEAAGRRLFYRGWLKSQVSDAPGRKRSARLGAVRRLFAGSRPDAQALLVKDIRMFLRDPVQWTQVVIFFGLLALYFINLRNFKYHLLVPEWRNLIVFLNMFSVATVICSLCSRFVYPQMSLEGQSFWVVGMSPLSMRRVVWAKFGLSCGVLLAISTALMLLSTGMLQVEPALRILAVVLSGGICITVSGLSIGLGAVFMDLKQRNPAAIVSSFGGTLNLVLGMAFTFAVMLPVATIFHAHAMGRMADGAFRAALMWTLPLLLVATALCTWIPLRLGERSLVKRDY